LGVGADAFAVASVDAALSGVGGAKFGVGKDDSTIAASLMAALKAAARFIDFAI